MLSLTHPSLPFPTPRQVHPAQLQLLLDPQSSYSALEFHHLLSACGEHGRALLLAHLAVDGAVFCSAYRGLGLAAVNG